MLWLASMMACERVDPCAATALVDEPRLELGLGDPEGFGRPAEDGVVVVPDWGAQGGRHVWLSVRTAGLWPGDRRSLGEDDDVPEFVATLVDDATGELLTEQSWAWEAMDGDEVEATLALGELFLPSNYASYYSTTPTTPSEPQAVRLEVAATDVCGTELTADLAFALDW